MANGVRKIREELSMCRKEFAEALNLSYGAISNYENYPERRPDLDVAYSIIDLAQSKGKLKTLEDIYLRDDHYTE